jgi:hypothetical protein
MSSLVFAPDVIVIAAAVVLLLIGRFARLRRSVRRSLPAIVVALVAVALAAELWAGATLGSYLGGALLQDRFSLFAKAVALVVVGTAIAVTDWSAEDSLTISLAMPLLAAFGVMVAASAGDLVALWAGLELAAAAGVVLVSLRRPDLGLRLLIAGGVASALLLTGLAFVYATAGTADLQGLRHAALTISPTLSLAIPVLLLLAGLSVRASLAPFHIAGIPVSRSDRRHQGRCRSWAGARRLRAIPRVGRGRGHGWGWCRSPGGPLAPSPAGLSRRRTGGLGRGGPRDALSSGVGRIAVPAGRVRPRGNVRAGGHGSYGWGGGLAGRDGDPEAGSGGRNRDGVPVARRRSTPGRLLR